ncbi:MAG: radical SAM protein [Calditrichaeota bacterium]|nr:radical SAM protein [Calditrichota bacterium]
MLDFMRIDRVWKSTSVALLDTILRQELLRKWILKQGERQLYKNFIIENPDDRPDKVQELRYRVMKNLFLAVDKALEEGRISPSVRHAVINNFVGNVIIGESDRQAPFREKYGFDPPTFLTISPTRHCNLNCIGCYAGSDAKSWEKLDYDVLTWIMEEKRREWGSHFTVISGGEPLMYKTDDGHDIFDLFEDFNDNYFLMYTNSTLITPEVAKRLADLGNVTPAISVEGFEKETDERRGKGVFKKILQAFENLRNAGVPFGISATATRQNVDVLMSDEFVDFYFEKQGAIYGWMFQYMPIGRKFTLDLMVTPEQRLEMYKREEYMIYNRNVFLVDFWNGGPISNGCISAGRSGGYFYIDWNGHIAPCVFFPYYVADAKELYQNGGHLSDVLMHPLFKAIRNWQDSYGYRRPAEKVGNYIVPCPIRDHYKMAYSAIIKTGAKPLDPNAAEALEDEGYRKGLIEYGKKVDELTRPIWEKDYIEPVKRRKQMEEQMPKVA